MAQDAHKLEKRDVPVNLIEAVAAVDECGLVFGVEIFFEDGGNPAKPRKERAGDAEVGVGGKNGTALSGDFDEGCQKKEPVRTGVRSAQRGVEGEGAAHGVPDENDPPVRFFQRVQFGVELGSHGIQGRMAVPFAGAGNAQRPAVEPS